MKKCSSCGNVNPDAAAYCAHCGNKLIDSDISKKILLVVPVATSNFFLTRTLKNNGFEVKSLRSSSFILDELSRGNYHSFIIDLDLSETNKNFLRTLNKLYPKQHTIIMTQTATKQDIAALKAMNFLSVLIKPVKSDTILQHLKKADEKPDDSDVFKYGMCSIDILDIALSKYIKENDITYIVGFILENFSKKDIKSDEIATEIDKIFNSIKRSDNFLLIENLGILIIPGDEMNDSGANILKNKLKKLIKKGRIISDGIIRYPQGSLTISEVCTKIAKGEFEKRVENKNIDINKTQSEDLDAIPQEELFQNKHLIFSALYCLSGKDVAILYSDIKLKKIVAPFVTISQARIIKETGKDIQTKETEQKFIKEMLNILYLNKIHKNDGIDERINSDISLMTLPEVQNNIIMLINEEASFKRIVSEIQKDAAISSKVLKLVNSAFFGFPRRIKNLERAAAILGTEEILGLSLSVSYIDSLNKNVAFIKKLWQENIAIMSVIKFIENLSAISTSSVTPSILSNVGKIFFAQYFPEQYIKTVKESQKTSRPYAAVELKYFSIPHTKVGASVMDMWNLPEKMKLSALYHDYPSAISKLNTSLHLIHAANYITAALGYATSVQPIESMSYYTYTMLIKKHGVDTIKIYNEQQEEIKKYIDDMMFLLT